MTTSITAAFRGIPPILNRIWRTRKGDWFKAGSAFAIEIKNTSPHGIDLKERADGLSDAVANLDPQGSVGDGLGRCMAGDEAGQS